MFNLSASAQIYWTLSGLLALFGTTGWIVVTSVLSQDLGGLAISLVFSLLCLFCNQLFGMFARDRFSAMGSRPWINKLLAQIYGQGKFVPKEILDALNESMVRKADGPGCGKKDPAMFFWLWDNVCGQAGYRCNTCLAKTGRCGGLHRFPAFARFSGEVAIPCPGCEDCKSTQEPGDSPVPDDTI